MVRYACADCEAFIEPDYTWAMESTGVGNDMVLITYHCPCCEPDGFIHARYGTVPYAVAFLMKGDFDRVHQTVQGGWWWENEVQLRHVGPYDPVLCEFREELGRIKNVDDFVRATGKGYPPEPPDAVPAT